VSVSNTSKKLPLVKFRYELFFLEIRFDINLEDHIKVDMTSADATPKPPGPLRFLFCAGGIFICYFFYGILQERM
jgi:hypothetical protein